MAAGAGRRHGPLRTAARRLDVAAEAQTGPAGALFVPLRQQELADAVSTAREVVARTLRDLSAAGLVETSRRGVRLRDASGLQVVAEGKLGDLGHPAADGGH